MALPEKSALSGREYVELAKKARESEDREAEITVLEEAVSIHPMDIELQFTLIRAFLRLNRFKEAESATINARKHVTDKVCYYDHMLLEIYKTNTLNWGALIKASDTLLDNNSIDAFPSVLIHAALYKAVAYQELNQYAKAKEILTQYYNQFHKAGTSVPVGEIINRLQFFGMYSEALEYINNLFLAVGSVRVANNINLSNAALSMTQAIENRKWMLKDAPSVKLVSLGQNCLPFVMGNRLGLSTNGTADDKYTIFDLCGMPKSIAANLVRDDLTTLLDHSLYTVAKLPGSIPMMRHKSGAFFSHERGEYFIGEERAPFFAHIDRTVKNFKSVTSTGPVLFFYAVVGDTQLSDIVAAVKEKFSHLNMKLLIINFMKTRFDIETDDKIAYHHIPYPDDYSWNFAEYHTSDRGLEFEQKVTRVIRNEMLSLQQREKPAKAPLLQRVRIKK